ncbi:hypothetical protein EXN66_Car020409 [Channa argus]|uniref:Uncharacterized protein n=1 Tax=Channa argus TaxID=215402 RepID=A0A6G1QQW3_CHAAH|nr:hypothetical protein EXN66_Car020409 [Channa argus]KAK2885107.1 hypothetical protein Q8A73_021581 [Channa argus]
MLLLIPSLNSNGRQRDGLGEFLDVTNTSPLHCCTYEAPGAPALTLVQTVFTRFRPSAKLTQLDPNFSLPAQQPPALRQSQRGLTWRPVFTGCAQCQSEVHGGEEGVGGNSWNLIFSCQPIGSMRVVALEQHCSVIGAELLYGQF